MSLHSARRLLPETICQFRHTPKAKDKDAPKQERAAAAVSAHDKFASKPADIKTLLTQVATTQGEQHVVITTQPALCTQQKGLLDAILADD